MVYLVMSDPDLRERLHQIATASVAGSPQQLVRDQLEEGFSRDVRSIGHYGTGDLELRIENAADFAKARPVIQQSYSNG